MSKSISDVILVLTVTTGVVTYFIMIYDEARPSVRGHVRILLLLYNLLWRVSK